MASNSQGPTGELVDAAESSKGLTNEMAMSAVATQAAPLNSPLNTTQAQACDGACRGSWSRACAGAWVGSVKEAATGRAEGV